MAESTDKIAFKGTGASHTNGNVRTPWGKVRDESLGFLVAEGVSIATGLGVVAIADRVIPKPLLKCASHTLAKIAIEPFLDNIEWGLAKICKLEECQVDTSVPREERAEALARTMIIFGTAYAASMAVKLYTRRKINEAFGIIEHKPGKLPEAASLWKKLRYYAKAEFMMPQEKLIVAADEGVHYGSMLLLNGSLAPITDDMIKSSARIIQKVTGVDEKKSREISNMFWIWDAPNILGALTGVGVIAGNHALGLSTKGWLGKFLANKYPSETANHVEKLALQDAVTPHLFPGT